MKNILFKSMTAAAAIALLAGCDENAWNDHLDGFESDKPIANVQTVEYTLTDADYKAIADNSTNRDLAGDELADALAAVGTQGYFTSEIPVGKYAPAFMSTLDFPYFTLDNGSAVKLTYKTTTSLPAQIAASAAAKSVRLSTADYQEAWGSEEDYISAFAPSVTAAANLPKILLKSLPDAVDGDYAFVTYYESSQEPVFTTPEETETIYLEESFIGTKGDFTIENVLLPEGVTEMWEETEQYGMKVTGFKGGENYDSETWLISPEIKLDAPAIMSFEQAMNFFADLATAAREAGVYIREKGGNWTQLTVPNLPEKLSWSFVNTGDIDLSAWNGKTVQIGFCYKSTSTKAGTWEFRNLVVKSGSPAKAAMRAPAAQVPTVQKFALYTFNGTAWVIPGNFAVLQPADYTAMGQSYPNFSSSEVVASCLPIYLKNAFPYAVADDMKFVFYQYFSNKVTSLRCDQYTFDGTEWVLNNGVTVKTGQFVKENGKWAYNPDVTMTLPAGKNQPLSTLYFQTCVDWVKSSIPNGAKYVTSYGNNEYYSGTSAYQGNVDLRADAAKGQYPEGYNGMSNEEIVALMKTRFENEVFPAALAILHPDAEPVEGRDVIYTFTFSAYDGINTTPYVITYKVVGPVKFELVSCTWND